MSFSWKDDWEKTKDHFVGWWQHDDLILCGSALPLATPHESTADPGAAPNITHFYTQPEWKAQWNHHRLAHQTFFESYSRVYDIIKMADGSAAFGAFRLWGPGKVAKVQCDTSAMFSPRMFDRFVTPALTAQCEWLDCSMFHLDGHQCIPHLDLLLDIEPLDAIE